MEEDSPRKEYSKIHNILYDILLKFNGQYRQNELENLSIYERNCFYK